VSDQSSKALSPVFFFESVTVKTAVEIGESAGTGDYAGLDKNWDHVPEMTLSYKL
jgi:hypothetical protein